jgi:hypothetical protein
LEDGELMAIPWLRILDTVVGLSNLSGRGRGASGAAPTDLEQAAGGSRALGQLDARLAGVMVAALKEVFERDTRRLELEREQMERERQRAERLLKLELWRQAGDREIGRLRLLAGVAVASWLGTLFFVSRAAAGPIAARVLTGAGWALLLAALAAAFSAQSRISALLSRIDEPSFRQEDLATGAAAGVPWLIVAGLAAVGVAVLLP